MQVLYGMYSFIQLGSVEDYNQQCVYLCTYTYVRIFEASLFKTLVPNVVSQDHGCSVILRNYIWN